jgi:hypothetical protein
LATVEIPIQIQLGQQQRQILEILHLQGMAFQLIALLGNSLPVGDNVQVVAPQLGLRHLVWVEQASGQFVKKLGLAVFVDAFKTIIAQAQLERRQRAALKETQRPTVKHQLLMKIPFFSGRLARLCF